MKYIFYVKSGELSEFRTAFKSFKKDSGVIPEELSYSSVIPVPFWQNLVIPADSGAILVELPDSRWNLWGIVKYCNMPKVAEHTLGSF